MFTLAIDIETFSDQEIGKVGVYRYVDTPAFRILLFAYAIDGGEVEVVDLTKDSLPAHILAALTDPSVTKTAFNASFERVCLDRAFGITSGPWECTMIKAWACGIGGGLASVGDAIGLGEDEGKIKDGKRLIKKFCSPQKGERQLAMDEDEDWEKFIEYCRRDVEVEMRIREKLDRFDLPDSEWALYRLDQAINSRGVALDMDLVHGAMAIDGEMVKHLTARYKEITRKDNPNSLADIKAFIHSVTGDEVKSVTKGNIDELIATYAAYPEVVEVLEIRKQLSKTSTAKYYKMEEIVIADGRARGLFQFYGARRTGRWAGRLIQAQNLPRNYIADLDTARDLIKTGDLEALDMAYDDGPDIMSQCLRTAIVPSEGRIFAVADYSAIEARVIAWFAGEDWVLDVFRTTGKIYEATAAKMFHVPVESIKKGSDMRQRGKVATLALGYQGGVGALKSMGALKMGIPEEDLQPIVDMWREANPGIVQLWYETQSAIIRAIWDRKPQRFADGKLTAYVSSGMLQIVLPSGRRLFYAKPCIGENRFGGDSIVYYERNSAGTDWLKRETYGGSLVENIVQATARDILGHAMLSLDRAGYEIVMHIHDEVVIEAKSKEDLDRICAMMGEPPEWCADLPLKADGFTCRYYQKD